MPDLVAPPAAPEPAPEPADIDAIAAKYEAQAADAPPADAVPPVPEATTPPAPPAVPEPAVDEQTAQRFEMLAAQQRELRTQQEAFRAERETAQTAAAATQEELAAFQAFRTKLSREDALGALADMGISFDDLSRAALDGKGVNPTSALEEQMTTRLQTLESQMKTRVDQLEAVEQRRLEEAAFADISTSIREHSPLVAALGPAGVNAVWQRYQAIAASQQHLGESLQLPDYQTVIREVEEAARLQATPLLPFLSAAAAQPPSPNAPAAPASPTLSNDMAASVPTRTLAPNDTDLIDDPLARLDAIAAKYG